MDTIIYKEPAVLPTERSLEHMVLLCYEEQLMDLIQDRYLEIGGIAKRHYFWSCFYLLYMLIFESESESEIKELSNKMKAKWRFFNIWIPYQDYQGGIGTWELVLCFLSVI